MAPRVRAAASACLVASGLLMSGVGGAIALADPARAARTTARVPTTAGDRTTAAGDDSIGDIVRRAFGMDDGSGEKASEPRTAARHPLGQRPWAVAAVPAKQQPTSRTPRRRTQRRRPTETPTTAECPKNRVTDPPTVASGSTLDPTSRNQVAVAAALSSSCRATSRRRCPICSCPVNYSLPSPECPVGPPRSRRAQVLWLPRRPSVPRCRSRCR